jgi:hypothetical protein
VKADAEEISQESDDLDKMQNPQNDAGGYMSLAQWMAGCDDFFVLRKFSKLTAFAMLKLQDDLLRCEKEIESLDLRQSGLARDRDSFRYDEARMTGLIDDQVIPKLRSYCKLFTETLNIAQNAILVRFRCTTGIESG